MKCFYVFFLLLGLGLSSCAMPIDTGPDLKATSRTFIEAMRWSDFYGASNFLVGVHREQLIQQFKDEDLRIVDSRIERVQPDPEGENALIDYQLEYYRLPSNRIKKWSWQQQWQWVLDEETNSGLWLIQNTPPAFP